MSLNMSTSEKDEFVYTWNIKHFHRFPPYSWQWIHSPSFKIEYFKEAEWEINLMWALGSMQCLIYRCSELIEPISIGCRYEVTTATGVVLKTSEALTYTFDRNSPIYCFNQPNLKNFSKPFSVNYDLFKLEDGSVPEEICLRCRIIPCRTPSMTSSSPSVVGWKAETDIFEAENIFEWSLMFSGCNQWTAVERVITENIPIDVKFEYIEDALNIELFPKIVDNKCHNLDCAMVLIREGYLREIPHYNAFEFNNTTRIYKLSSSIKKRHLEERNCFINKKLNIAGRFINRYSSSITEIRNFEGNSGTVNHAVLTQNKDELNCIPHLQQHLRNMLNKKTYADVELRVDDEVFFAHKCLLASRSPVFETMLNQDMLESKTNVVDITDVEAKIVKYFLEYIYTGTLNDLTDEIALKLLVVADKYQVPPLTERCSAFLKSVLSLENVLNVLLVADLVNQEQLKLSSVDYIVENSTQVLSSPTGPQWMKANPALASEIFLKLSKKFDSNSNPSKEAQDYVVEKGLTFKENSAKENLNMNHHLAVETAEENSSISTAASSLVSAFAASPVRGNQNANVLADAKTTVETPDSSLQYGNQNSAALVDASSENKSEKVISTAPSPKTDLKEDKQVEGEIGKCPPWESK